MQGKAACIRPKVVGPFPGPYASRNYVHWTALFYIRLFIYLCFAVQLHVYLDFNGSVLCYRELSSHWLCLLVLNK
jgi:hypothetical protein